MPAIGDAPLQEWNWISGDCTLTVWFHHPADHWQVLYEYYWNEHATL